MNNIITRSISGTFFAIILMACCCDEWFFLGMFFCLMNACISEFSKMLHLQSKTIYWVCNFLYLSNLDRIFLPSAQTKEIIQAATIILIAMLFIKVLFTKKIKAVEYLGKFFLTLLYTCLPFIFIAEIPFGYDGASFNSHLILGILILTWSNDTFAYVVGKMIGKHKLFERISPKKTIEGFFGGIVFTVITAVIISAFYLELSLVYWIYISFIISIFGVIGDLIASMFKRQFGCKDFGTIIIGHGGVLDRLDSLIFVAPLIYVFLNFI